MIPVSLYGKDISPNLIQLQEKTHIDLHKTLDIPTKEYSKRTRNFKIKTNHKSIRTPQDIDMIYDIQSRFFDNINKLPKTVQQQHLHKMRELAQRELQRALQL